MPALTTANDAGPAWFIKPHHIESITQHKNSIKDDILNTRYFSHYNKNYGKENTLNNKELAIEYIEQQIELAKSRQEIAAKKIGLNTDNQD